MLAGRIGGLRCGGPLFDLQRLRVEMPVISYHAPSHGRGMLEGQGGWPKMKESEANLRRYAPPPSKGRREKRDE